MFRERVADHYRAKGYQVHENLRVSGASGSAYVVDMVCQGPLGNLLVSFGDAGGVDAPEMGSVRRIAKDLGMTPVLAAEAFSPEFRHHAMQNGVVLLDASLHPSSGTATAAELAGAGPGNAQAEWPGFLAPTLDRKEFDAHPWPQSGRAHPEDPDPSAVREAQELVAAAPGPTPRGRSSLLWPLTRKTEAGAAGPGETLVPSPPSSTSVGPVVPAPPRPAPPPPAQVAVRGVQRASAPSAFSWLGAGRGHTAPDNLARKTAGSPGSSGALQDQPRTAAQTQLHADALDPSSDQLQHTTLMMSQDEPLGALARARNHELLRAMESRLRKRVVRRRIALAGGIAAAVLLVYFFLR